MTKYGFAPDDTLPSDGVLHYVDPRNTDVSRVPICKPLDYSEAWRATDDWGLVTCPACSRMPVPPLSPMPADPVNHPSHYTSDPSGVECITITRHRNFNVGNAIKYLWRAGLKSSPDQSALDKQLEDLRKAVFYINDEITRLEATASPDTDRSN